MSDDDVAGVPAHQAESRRDRRSDVAPFDVLRTGLGGLLDFAWNGLGRERADPALPRALRDQVGEGRFLCAAVIAELGTAGRLCVFQADGRTPAARTQMQFALQLQQHWPCSLVFFANRRFRRWDLCVGSASPDREGQHLRRFVGVTRNPLPPAASIALEAMRTARGAGVVQPLRELFLAGMPFPCTDTSLLGSLPPALRSEFEDLRLADTLRRLGTLEAPSPDDEVRLGARIRAGDEAAAHELVLRNARYALWRARQRTRSPLPIEDRLQYALLGLLTAARRFDSSLGARFTTYGNHWILSLIGRAEQTEPYLIRVPAQRFGAEKSPSADPDCDLSSLFDPFPGPYETAQARLDTEALIERALACFRGSERRLREVVCLRFGLGGQDPLSLEQVGEQLGVTRERVRQLEVRAIARLKSRMGTGPKIAPPWPGPAPTRGAAAAVEAQRKAAAPSRGGRRLPPRPELPRRDRQPRRRDSRASAERDAVFIRRLPLRSSLPNENLQRQLDCLLELLAVLAGLDRTVDFASLRLHTGLSAPALSAALASAILHRLVAVDLDDGMRLYAITSLGLRELLLHGR